MENNGRDRAIRDLLESPLGPERSVEPRSWRPVLAGALVGAVLTVGAGVSIAEYGGAAPTTDPAEAAPTTTPGDTRPLAAPDARYPPSFLEVTDGAALAPLAIVEIDERRFVSVASFMARGEETPQRWFRGGRWELAITGGERIPMTRAIREPLLPGVFTLEFDVPGDAAPVALHLVERWDADVRQATASVELPEFPFVLDDPVTIRITDDVSLVVEALELGTTDGRLAWRVVGADRLAGELVLGVGLFDEANVAMPGYGARGRGFVPGFFPGDTSTFLTAAQTAGETALFGANTRGATPVRAEISVTVPLLRTFPASLEHSLSGVTVVDGR